MPSGRERSLIVSRGIVHSVKLSTFDLNHVRALHFLLEEAHVARAARRLSITPAAASNALHRLRVEFDDPLLVRVGRAFARTPLAEELRGPARNVIGAAEALVDAAVPFDPRTYDGAFVLTTSDRIAEVLVRPLDALLAARAPRSKLHLRTLSGPVPPALPEERGLFVVPSSAHRLRAELLFKEGFVCVLRAGHPLAKGKLSRSRYAAAEHVLVAPRGDSERGLVDLALAAHGLEREISRVVTSFILALALVERSDRIVTLPSSFLTALRSRRGLAVRPPPVEVPPVTMEVAWHAQQDGDPRYAWFRALIHEVARGLRVPAP
jgi:DNA-binding transcriptional LysR family regulator